MSANDSLWSMSAPCLGWHMRRKSTRRRQRPGRIRVLRRGNFRADPASRDAPRPHKDVVIETLQSNTQHHALRYMRVSGYLREKIVPKLWCALDPTTWVSW